MSVKLVYSQIMWLNFFVSVGYISNIFSPGSILYIRKYNYNIIRGIEFQFEDYFQTHQSTTNSMVICNVNGNFQEILQRVSTGGSRNNCRTVSWFSLVVSYLSSTCIYFIRLPSYYGLSTLRLGGQHCYLITKIQMHFNLRRQS